MKKNQSSPQPLQIGATTFSGPLGNTDTVNSFHKDADQISDCIAKHWEPKHPERHALVFLFDEYGNIMISDSHTPDEPGDEPTPSVEAHRLMFAILLSLTDPDLANDIWSLLSALVADCKVEECINNNETPDKLPQWVSEYFSNASDLINGRVQLVKVNP